MGFLNAEMKNPLTFFERARFYVKREVCGILSSSLASPPAVTAVATLPAPYSTIAATAAVATFATAIAVIAVIAIIATIATAAAIAAFTTVTVITATCAALIAVHTTAFRTFLSICIVTATVRFADEFLSTSDAEALEYSDIDQQVFVAAE